MTTCPNCQKQIDDLTAVCPHCGTNIYYCIKCREIQKGRRCAKCGSATVPVSDRASMLAVRPSQRPADPVLRRDIARRAARTDIRVPKKATVLVRRDIDGVVLQLSDGAVIGRTKGRYVPQMCSLAYVSGSHARIDYNPAMRSWTITDLGSTNGTKINGRQIEPEKPEAFGIGDTVTLAFTDFIAQ